jgi:hypothetical protein
MRLFVPVLTAGSFLIAGGFALGATAWAAPQAAEAKAATILPGQWEYSYRLGIIPAGSESRCLKPADVAQFSKGICTKRYTCDYDTRVVQDGKIALKGRWTDKKGRVAPVTAKGAYTPESFRLNVKLKTINGLPLAGVMDAKRISPVCEAG